MQYSEIFAVVYRSLVEQVGNKSVSYNNYRRNLSYHLSCKSNHDMSAQSNRTLYPLVWHYQRVNVSSKQTYIQEKTVCFHTTGIGQYQTAYEKKTLPVTISPRYYIQPIFQPRMCVKPSYCHNASNQTAVEHNTP